MPLFSPNIRRCSAGGLSESDCSAINDCQWLPELSQCAPACSALAEDICAASIGCSWDGSKCQRRSKKEQKQWRPNVPKRCANQLSKRECEVASGSGGMGDGCAWMDGQCQERVIITVNPDKPAGARAWTDKSVDSKTAVWVLSGTFITIAILIGIFSFWWNWNAIWISVRTVGANFRQGLAAARDGVVGRGRRLTRRRSRLAPEATSDDKLAVDVVADVAPESESTAARDDRVNEGGVNEGGVDTPSTPRPRAGSNASVRALPRTPPPRRRSGSVSSRAAISPPPVSPPTTPSTPRRISSTPPLASPARGPPAFDLPKDLDMTPRATRPTPRSTPALPADSPADTPVWLPDVREMRKRQDSEIMRNNERMLDELRQQSAAIGRRRATQRAVRKTATPKPTTSTPQRSSLTPPTKDTSGDILAQLRQDNLEQGARKTRLENEKQQDGQRRYREIMDQQKRKAITTPRTHSMRTPIKTGGKRRRGRMTEGQITRAVNTFLDELTGGRKKKSRSNTRTQHVGRKAVGRRRRQRRG